MIRAMSRSANPASDSEALSGDYALINDSCAAIAKYRLQRNRESSYRSPESGAIGEISDFMIGAAVP
jgi:hypothetical protein